jgi:hypothetical protein
MSDGFAVVRYCVGAVAAATLAWLFHVVKR